VLCSSGLLFHVILQVVNKLSEEPIGFILHPENLSGRFLHNIGNRLQHRGQQFCRQTCSVCYDTTLKPVTGVIEQSKVSMRGIRNIWIDKHRLPAHHAYKSLHGAVLLGNLTVAQSDKSSPDIYRTRRFIFVYERSRH
jgi:hypothetical protein